MHYHSSKAIFVLFNIGNKLLSLDDDVAREIYRDHPSLMKIPIIYQAWIRPLPCKALEDPSFNNPNAVYCPPGDDESEDGNDGDDPDCNTRSMKTKPGRGANWPCPIISRTKPAEKAPVVNNPKRSRKVLSESYIIHNQNLPSEFTLSSLKQLGRVGWTGDSICEWSKATSRAFKKRRILYPGLA